MNAATETVGRQTPTPPAQQSPVGREPSRLAALRPLAKRFGPPLAAFGTVKLIGFLVFLRLVDVAGDFHRKPIEYGGGAKSWDTLASWDGIWYEQIAQHGYHPQLVELSIGQYQQNSAAFFPLYPGLMRLVSELTGLGPFGAGMTVSVIGSFLAAAGIFAVTTKFSTAKAGIIAAAIWGLFPGSGAEWAIYSDSTFVALAAWSCYAVMSHRWLTAGVLTFVAGLNRPTSAALIAGLGVAGLIALFKRTDGIWRPLAAMAMAPIGLFGFVGWVGWRMGDWGGYFKLQSDAWIHYFDYGHFTHRVLGKLLHGRFDYFMAFPMEDMVALALLFALPVLIILMLRMRPPVMMVVYVFVTLVSVLGSMGIFGNISRYLLPCFPLFIPLAIALRRVGWVPLAGMLGATAAASGWYASFVLFGIGIP